MNSRQKTAPYPGNSRSEWVVDWRIQPNRYSDGLVHFEYALYAIERSRAAGDLPFLLNSHKAMIREKHQRIAKTSSGLYRHISGIDVPPDTLDEFLRADLRAYRWVAKARNKWTDGKGRSLVSRQEDASVFPTYWGVPQAFDSQWVRERYQISQRQQVAAIVSKYLASVEAGGLYGDRRGTVLDLQVAAVADDINHDAGHTLLQTQWPAGHSGSQAIDSWARFNNVTIVKDLTIDVAFLTITPNLNLTKTILTNVTAEDSDDAPVVADDTDWHNRTLTTAFIAYDGAHTWVIDAEEDLTSMVAGLREIVSRASWVSGNDMGFFWNDD